MSMTKKVALTLLLGSLFFAGCATTETGEMEPPVMDTASSETAAAIDEATPSDKGESKEEEGEVPITVAESEKPAAKSDEEPEEVVVEGRALNRHQAIRDLVAEGQALLRDV